MKNYKYYKIENLKVLSFRDLHDDIFLLKDQEHK